MKREIFKSKHLMADLKQIGSGCQNRLIRLKVKDVDILIIRHQNF